MVDGLDRVLVGGGFLICGRAFFFPQKNPTFGRKYSLSGTLGEHSPVFLRPLPKAKVEQIFKLLNHGRCSVQQSQYAGDLRRAASRKQT